MVRLGNGRCICGEEVSFISFVLLAGTLAYGTSCRRRLGPGIKWFSSNEIFISRLSHDSPIGVYLWSLELIRSPPCSVVDPISNRKKLLPSSNFNVTWLQRCVEQFPTICKEKMEFSPSRDLRIPLCRPAANLVFLAVYISKIVTVRWRPSSYYNLHYLSAEINQKNSCQV